jgi:hypothetical protein
VPNLHSYYCEKCFQISNALGVERPASPVCVCSVCDRSCCFPTTSLFPADSDAVHLERGRCQFPDFDLDADAERHSRIDAPLIAIQFFVSLRRIEFHNFPGIHIESLQSMLNQGFHLV